VGIFLSKLENAFDDKSEITGHWEKAQLELLKALRSIVDNRIERLENKRAASPPKGMTKIKVE
jgi:hypothetical protein